MADSKLFDQFTAAPSEIQHIIRMMNTNINGSKRIAEALSEIRGIGKRMSDVIVKKAGIDNTKRAGELDQKELDMIQRVIQSPMDHGIPQWMLNHPFDVVDGSSSHLVANQIEADFRLYIEKGKKIKHGRICRLAKGLKVNGQRTKSNGRHGKTVGVSRKK